MPSSLAGDIEAKAGPVTVRVKVVSIGGRSWITNPFSREWQRLPGTTALAELFDPAGGVRAIVEAMADVRPAGQEKMGGVEAYRLEGEVDSMVLQAFISRARPGFPVKVTVWVGTDDFLPRRVRIVGRLSMDEAADIVREIDLSRFDAPVEIKPPV